MAHDPSHSYPQYLPSPTLPDDRNWAVAAHLSGLLWWTTALHIIIPLVIWLLKREKSPYVGDQAKEALNAQISFTAYAFVAGLLIYVLIGFVLLALVCIVFFILSIRAAIVVSKGGTYRYPLIFRLVT